MTTYYWDSFRGLFASIEAVENYGLPIISETTDKLEAVVTLDFCNLTLSSAFESLAALLGVEIDNGGNLYYDASRQLRYYGQPQVLLIKDNGEFLPALKIGCDLGEYKSVVIPLEIKGDDYYLNGIRVDLVRFPGTDVISEKMMLSIEQKRGDAHFFPMRLPKDVNLDEVKDNFDDGRLHNVLQANDTKWFKATNFLEPVFRNGNFPDTGILFKLMNPKLSEVIFEDKPIRSVRFSVAACSHPDLICRTNESKNWEELPLTHLTNLSFNGNSKAYTQTVNGFFGEDDEVYFWVYDHAKDKNGNAKFEHTPDHLIGTSLRFFPVSAKTLADTFVKKQPNTIALPPSEVPTIEVASKVVDEKELAPVGGTSKSKAVKPKPEDIPF